MAGRQLHGGGQRIYNSATSQVTFLTNACKSLNQQFVWQACTSWKRFILDQTLGTREGRRRLYEEKLVANWTKGEESTATLAHVGTTGVTYCRFLVCNDWLIFCGGIVGTEVFNISGKKLRILTKEETAAAAVGKETFGAVVGQGSKRVTLWSTRGEMASCTVSS